MPRWHFWTLINKSISSAYRAIQITNNYNILKQYNNLEHRDRLSLNLMSCFLLLIVCFSRSALSAEAILPRNEIQPTWMNTMLLPTQVVPIRSEQSQALTNNSIPANLVAKNGKLPPYLLEEAKPTTDVTKQLWQERVSISKEPKFNKNKKELQQIIDQIASMEIKSTDQTPEPLISVDPIQKAEPNKTATETEISQEETSAKTEYKAAKGRITSQTLEIFKKLAQQPEKLHNPVELAEILFDSNYLDEAAMCYRQAFDRMNANQKQQPIERQWVLFQLGNCLQNSDKTASLQMYRQLIEEYPNSPWVEIAKAKSKLIDWYMQDKPYSLIGQQ